MRIGRLWTFWIAPWRWPYWNEPHGARDYFWACVPDDSDGLWWCRFFGLEISFERPQHRQR